MEEELKKRSEVALEDTWDLSLIYRSEEDLWKDMERFKELADKTVTAYRGKLDNSSAVAECLSEYAKIMEILEKAMNYTELAMSVDMTDGHFAENYGKVRAVVADKMSALSFIESEIPDCDDRILDEAAHKCKSIAGYLKEIIRNKPYRLHPEAERVLAANQESFDTPYNVYNQAKLSDMKFDSFVVNGKTYPMGYSLYEDFYEYDSDTDVRRKAAEVFYDELSKYANVTAAAYNAQVCREKVNADLRGYKDVYESLLFSQHVTRDMYDRQIDVIMEKLAPHMRKYAKLLQRIHGLDRMTYADLKIGVDPTYSIDITKEEAEKNISEALSIMGDDYEAMVREAFDKRWIDLAKNTGKSTGGFCTSPYGVPASFILTTWNGKMADVFTLAHELGHAGHFKAANAQNSVFDKEVSWYFVEAPSTMNEILLADYLVAKNDDPRFKRWALSCLVGDTYYHNFVTHFLEAAYQREVYRIVDEGGSVHADRLNGIMQDVLKKFWGDTVELTKGAELTWMRQPHYYMGLYSYTYSAGLTVATEVAERIKKEGQSAVEDWKKVLRAGGTLDPVGLAALAKVDITTDKPLLDTIDHIGDLIDEICRLTDQLGF